jgi:hypothetical protein
MNELFGVHEPLPGLRAVAEAFAELGARIGSAGASSVLQAVTDVTRERLGGASAVSVTQLRRDHFVTATATDDRARRADAIQYELGSGPCIDAILKETLYWPLDLRTDPRWPDYGRRVAEEVGFLSMLSYRMVLGTDEIVAGLNIYADHVDAFSDTDVMLGLLLATHGAQAAAAAGQREHANHLERALRSNRLIGTAMGILMARHVVTQDQSFDLLRIASQNSNRKLADIAREVIETGTLDVASPGRNGADPAQDPAPHP